MAKKAAAKTTKSKAQRVLDEVQRASRIVAARLRLELRGHKITDSELTALTLLLERERMSIGELGRELVLTTGARTYLVNRLERAGLARRLDWEKDGRFFLVELSPKGRSFISGLLNERSARAPAYVAALTQAEQVTLANLLGKLCDSADRYERPGRVQ